MVSADGRGQTAGMFARRQSVAPIGAVLLGLVTAGCGGDDGARPLVLSDQSVIVYRFFDSSVPPEFHRSYTATIDRDQVAIEVDSYGELVSTAEAPMEDAVWDLLAEVPGELTTIGPTSDDCEGGTARGLEITDPASDGAVIDVRVDVCDSGGQRAAEQIEEYVAPALDLLGDLEVILRPG